MSEWWTYRLSSFLPFSPRTYFRLHELYNAEIWPAHVVALALAIAIVAMVRRGGTASGRVVPVIVSACWLWVAWAFHVRRYATINWAATYFAAAFVLQAILLLWTGALRGRRTFDPSTPLRRLGLSVLLFAVVVQPAVGLLAGRSLRQSEYFGVSPDPTVSATLAVLLMAKRGGWTLWIIPLLWCAVSGAFQSMMRLPDALLMPFIGAGMVLAAALMTRSSRQARAG